MFTICYRHRPSRRSPGQRSEGPGQGPVKPESAGSGPIPGKTRGFLADTTLEQPFDLSGVIDADLLRRRSTWHPGHCHDLAADHHNETGTRTESHLPHRQ